MTREPEYTVVATDNAGNETTATVRTYRRHHVKVISPDGKRPTPI